MSAPGDDTGAFDAGAVFLFDLTGKVLATINNPAPAYGDVFGSAIASLGTDQILIGAHLDDVRAKDAGVVYRFDTEGKLIETIMNPEPTNQDFFGVSLAAVGPGHAVIGAHYADAAGLNAGAAFLVRWRSERACGGQQRRVWTCRSGSGKRRRRDSSAGAGADTISHS